MYSIRTRKDLGHSKPRVTYSTKTYHKHEFLYSEHGSTLFDYCDDSLGINLYHRYVLQKCRLSKYLLIEYIYVFIYILLAEVWCIFSDK